MTTTAEAGALANAISNANTNPDNRIGLAGFMQGMAYDIMMGTIIVPSEISTLTARGRMFNAFQNLGAPFYAPLVSTLALTRGTGTPTFTRADAIPCATHTDFEGIVRVVPANAARFQGCRVVYNQCPTPSNTLASGSNENLTVTAGTWMVSMGAGTGVLTFSGTSGATGTLTADASKRTVKVFSGLSAGTLIATASVATVVDIQYENATGRTDVVNPSEYVPVGTGGPLYGSELVTPQDFSSGWAIFNAATQSVTGGVITATNGSFGGTATTVSSVAVGKTYVVNITLVGGTSPSIQSGVLGTGNKNLSVGLNTFVVTAVSNQITLLLNSAIAGVTGIFSNVSVREAIYSGSGVDGLLFSPNLNGNTVASNVVTSGTGAAIKQGVAGVSASAPVDASGPLGYLAEGSRTNLCLQSADFSTTWASAGSVLTVGSTTTAPNGTNTAQLLIPSVANVAHQTIQNITGTAASYTISGYVKPGGYSKFGFRENTDTGHYAAFDLTASGTVITVSGCTATISALTNGWYRFTITRTATVSSEAHALYVMDTGYTTGSPASYAFAGNGTSGVYTWGIQIELGAFATSYIPAVASAVTKTLDLDSYPTSGNITAAKGTTYLEFTPTHAPSGTITLWGTYVDANNYTAILHDATNLIFRQRIASVNYDSTLALAFVAGTTYKVAASWSATNSYIAFNGTVGTGSGNGTAAQIAATMQIGADGNGASQPTAMIRNDRVWPTALTTAQMVSITA